MNEKSIWLRIFLSIIPILFLFLHFYDLADVFSGKYDYPFGSDYFSPNSIYKSRNFYTGFSLFSIFFLVVTLFLIWKQKWRWLLVVLLIDVAFFIYPFFAIEE